MVQWDTCGVASAIHEVLKWPVANRVASLGLFCNAGILNYLISKCLPVLMSHNSAIHKKAFIKNSFIWIHWQEASFQIADIQKKANRDVILNFLFFFFYKLGTECSKEPGGICFGSVKLKLGWIKSKSNCVVLIHVKTSLPSNILSPDKKNASIQFLYSGGLFPVFSFLQPLCCSHKKRKKGFHFSPSLWTKCLWGRLLSLAAGKGLLERKVSVPWLKQSPWQPVIKAPATFHRHSPLRRPFSILLTEYLHLWARVLCFWWYNPSNKGDVQVSFYSSTLSYSLLLIVNLVKNGVKFL